MNYRVNLLLGIIVTLHSVLFSQGLSSTTEFPLQSEYYGNSQAALCCQSDGSLRIFWADKYADEEIYAIKTAVSTDNGITWSGENTIHQRITNITDIKALATSVGRLIMCYGDGRYAHYAYSDNNGADWVFTDSVLITGFVSNQLEDFTEMYDGTLITIFSAYSSCRYITSTNRGESWSETKAFNFSFFENIIRECNSIIIDSSLFLSGEGYSDRFISIKYDPENDTVINDTNIIHTDIPANGYEIVNRGSSIVLLYSKIEDRGLPKSFSSDDNYLTADIYYKVSFDTLQTWSEEKRFTSAINRDILLDAAVTPAGIFTIFSREYKTGSRLWMGYADSSTDLLSQPLILDHALLRNDYSIQDTLVLRVAALDETTVKNVSAVMQEDGIGLPAIAMHDDGLAPDSKADDNIWTAKLLSPETNKEYTYSIIVTDNDGNMVTDSSGSLFFFNDVTLKYSFDANNLHLPFDNKGNIALVEIDNMNIGGYYNGKIFLFSGGFYLSGLAADSIWVFGVAGSVRDENCQPGPVGSDPGDMRNRIYVVSSSDPPFGAAWQEWKYAAGQGAGFIDGDGNGQYIPVDKNSNGVWDSNEDKPEILGDLTAFCVYNDGLPPELRDNLEDQIPRGIEIRQTLYGFNSQNPALANSIFIRYEVVNTGTVESHYDSVYFSFWNDADLGDYQDDLAGCDTILNTSYIYNAGPDEKYGSDPPALFTAFHNKLPGIESVSDTSQLLSSFTSEFETDVTMYIPHDAESIRNFMKGKVGIEQIDPCSWSYGTVNNENCADINPIYWYSGDPIALKGWLDNNPYDKRTFTSTGPFRLDVEEPVEIIISYTVGKGTDPLNSISVGKQYLAEIKGIPLVGLDDETAVLPSDFALSQNYPNPFNPVTTINYQLPVPGKVSLKVYDVLGQEVKTLVNEVQEAGYKTVQCDASKLASGVYIYKIKAGSFSASKKMILLK